VFSCDDFRNGLSDLVDDEAARALREKLERHLAECRTCQVLYDSTRKTIRIVTDAGSWEIPKDVSDRLAAKILSGVKKP
jgi:anti-sigma factor RsiW